jgi:hypothetical protein
MNQVVLDLFIEGAVCPEAAQVIHLNEPRLQGSVDQNVDTENLKAY